MSNSSNRLERWFYKNRNIGIPNLMLYITIGTAIVYLMCMFDQSYTLYSILCFDRTAILQGQVWRLLTFVFTYGAGSPNLLLIAISLFFYYTLGRSMEQAWGTFRFNLFYLTGIILVDTYAMVFNVRADITYLNMSLFLGFATLYPDARFLLLFFIPVKAWIFALIDLGLTLHTVIFSILNGNIIGGLFPLVALVNYFLFFGTDVVNILPPAWRSRRRQRRPTVTVKKTGTIPFSQSSTSQANPYRAKPASDKKDFHHRCTVCGRTDVSNPELEFRYCSRCNGYHCYCEDHINDHAHIE